MGRAQAFPKRPHTRRVILVRKTCEPQNATWSVAPGDAPGAICLAGEIDFSVAPKVREALRPLLAAKTQEILLDLSGLSYVDSSGLAVFIEARNALLAAGRSIRIVAISPQVRKLFNLTQLGDLFGLPEAQ